MKINLTLFIVFQVIGIVILSLMLFTPNNILNQQDLNIIVLWFGAALTSIISIITWFKYQSSRCLRDGSKVRKLVGFIVNIPNITILSFPFIVVVIAFFAVFVLGVSVWSSPHRIRWPNKSLNITWELPPLSFILLKQEFMPRTGLSLQLLRTLRAIPSSFPPYVNLAICRK